MVQAYSEWLISPPQSIPPPGSGGHNHSDFRYLDITCMYDTDCVLGINHCTCAMQTRLSNCVKLKLALLKTNNKV